MNHEECVKKNCPTCKNFNLDTCLSCTVIAIYIGFMSFLTYKFVNEYV